MNNKLIILVVILIATWSCTKDERYASRYDGNWNIDYIEVYNYLDEQLTLSDTYQDPGTVTLTDQNQNKHRTGVSPITNQCVFDWADASIPPNSILDLYFINDNLYWSIVTIKNEDIAKFQIMSTPGGDEYHYATFTVETINKNEQMWYYNSNNDDILDNNIIVYREVWKLIKAD